MPEIQDHFSYSAVYFFLIIAIVLVAAFRLLNFFIPALPIKSDYKIGIRKALPMAEFTAWIIFLIWGINYFIRYNIYFAIGLGIVVFLIMIWFSWFALRDLIAGIIIKTNRDLKKNEIVDVAGYHGKIIRFGFRNMILETENGKNIYLPYTMVIKRELVRSHPAEKILSHSFILTTEAKKPLDTTIDDIRRSILSLPWVSLTQKPMIRLENEKPGSYTFHITTFSIEQNYFMMIEKAIREAHEAQ